MDEVDVVAKENSTEKVYSVGSTLNSPVVCVWWR